MEFKIGDRVVRINLPLTAPFGVNVGTAGVIVSINSDRIGVKYDGYSEKIANYPKNLVHEEIYKSPLYQALI